MNIELNEDELRAYTKDARTFLWQPHPHRKFHQSLPTAMKEAILLATDNNPDMPICEGRPIMRIGNNEFAVGGFGDYCILVVSDV